MGAGYTGKVLMVDLTKREVETLELGEEVYRNFLGGYGLGARILFAHIPKGADPLGPDNVLGLTPGFNILPGGPPEEEPERVLDRCKELGTTFCFPHTSITDRLVDRLHNEIRDMGKYARMIRER